MRTRNFLLLSLLLSFWGFKHCSPGHHGGLNASKIQAIDDFEIIRNDIQNFQNQPVKLSGYVTYTFYMDFIGAGFYVLLDENGNKITVTTRLDVTPSNDHFVSLVGVPKVLLRANQILGVSIAELERLNETSMQATHTDRDLNHLNQLN